MSYTVLSNTVIAECETMILKIIGVTNMVLIGSEGRYKDGKKGWKNRGIRIFLKSGGHVDIVIEEDQLAKKSEKLVFGIKFDPDTKFDIPYDFTDKDGGPFIYDTERDGYIWLLYRSIKPDQLDEFFKFIELCIVELRGL